MPKASEELDAEAIWRRRAGRRRPRTSREKEAQVGAEMMRQLEKHLMLNVLDQSWKEHLARMDYLRQGIHLRGYAQKQPKQEYKRESVRAVLARCSSKVKREVVTLLARVRIRSEDEVAALEAAERRASRGAGAADAVPAPETPAATAPTRKPRRRRRRRTLGVASRSRAKRPRSAATIRAPAAAARSSSSATDSWPETSDAQTPAARMPRRSGLRRPGPRRRRRPERRRAAASCWRAAPPAATWPAPGNSRAARCEPGESRAAGAGARTARRTRHRRRWPPSP